MKKMLPLLACAVIAACTEAPAAEAPDPSEVERLVARMEAQKAAPALKARDKLEKVDRVAATVERVNPEKLGTAAERLLAR